MWLINLTNSFEDSSSGLVATFTLFSSLLAAADNALNEVRLRFSKGLLELNPGDLKTFCLCVKCRRKAFLLLSRIY